MRHTACAVLLLCVLALFAAASAQECQFTVGRAVEYDEVCSGSL